MALKANETFGIVSLPSGKHPIACKWVFTIRVNVDGTITWLKAQLVAK